MGKYLIVIVGPTAIGKTDLAIRLAREFETEIISADSRQFFKELNIGTAKPSNDELAAVPHHFINSHTVTENFNVGDFEVQALGLLKDLFNKRNVAILAGGSGLYIKAVTEGFDDFPETDPEIREHFNKLYQERGITAIQHQLKLLDPDYYVQVDIKNPQRIIRALEICIASGQPFSSFVKRSLKARPFKTIKIGLNINRELLYSRINIRVDKMIQAGLVKEVSQLTEYRHLNALRTVGYKEIFEYLDGKVELPKAVDNIKQNTRRFAKRQLTWFRKDEEITWFEPNHISLIVDFINSQLLSKPEQ